MTRIRLPNDFEDHESRALVEIMRKHASTFSDWGYDDTSFWVELDAQALKSVASSDARAVRTAGYTQEQVQLAMAPLVVRMRQCPRQL